MSDRSAQNVIVLQPRTIVLSAAILTIGGIIWFLAEETGRLAALFLVAIFMGLALYHASFGFSAAYRHLFRYGDTRGVDGQIILLAATMLIFAPVLTLGNVFGTPVSGAIAPVGLGMAFGAFIFGIGMQIGGSCASGTLFTVGSGNPRMMIVLLFFCIGAFWGSLDLAWWQSLPGIGAVSLGDMFGWDRVLPAQLLVLLALYLALGKLRRRTRETIETSIGSPKSNRLLRGPWPLIWGSLSLALLNGVTLGIAGHPWSITWGFTLWGAKIAAMFGWNPGSSDFWSGGFQQEALMNSIWHDTTSVMNFGILGGALFAMLLAKRVAPTWDRRWKPVLAAIIGGLMLGYGARLAYGCNIGAFISGAASASLHGWVWILCALPGNWIGMQLRRPFQMDI